MAERRDATDSGAAAEAPHSAQTENAEALPAPPESLRKSFAAAFDRTFWIFVVIAIVAGVACWVLEGREAVMESLESDVRLLIEILPRILAALAIAALVQVLIRREAVARALGEEAGAKGIALAVGAGAVTPGGPMTSFPLVNALQDAGGGRSALVAYLTSWSLLGFQRILTWEVPLMGLEFTAIRFLASLPLPFVAAAVSRLVPSPPGEPRP